METATKPVSKVGELFAAIDTNIDGVTDSVGTLVALAKLFAETVDFYIKADERKGDQEGANLKGFTLKLIREALDGLPGDCPPSLTKLATGVDQLRSILARRDFVPQPVGTVEVDGRIMMIDDRRSFVPIDAVKPQHKLEDETVRNVFGHAEALSAQVARFFIHTLEDLDAFDALLAQEYKVTRGGKKGNRTYTSYDGLRKIQVQVADKITFGPELQIAKAKIDEWLIGQIANTSDDLRAFVMRAFDVDKEGKVNQAELLRLRRLDIDGPIWAEAMRAIADAIRPLGTKQYIRFYRRAEPEGRWQAVTIDLAQV